MASIHFIHVGDKPRAPVVVEVPERVTVGTRIEYTGDIANQPGSGAVVSVEPADRWGGEYCRIILDDGRDLQRNDIRFLKPISERQGCAHRLLIDVGTADAHEVAELIAAAATRKADLAAKESEANQAFASRVAALKVEHPELVQGDDHKTAAKNIRKMLKSAFPKTKFSVVSPHYGTINVRWEDGPVDKQVEEITDRFSAGHFDGYDDSYKSSSSPWNKTFGSASYLFTNRDYSDALIALAIEAAAERYGAQNKPTVEDYRKGLAWNTSPVFDSGGNNAHDWQSLIHRKAAEISM